MESVQLGGFEWSEHPGLDAVAAVTQRRDQRGSLVRQSYGATTTVRGVGVLGDE